MNPGTLGTDLVHEGSGLQDREKTELTILSIKTTNTNLLKILKTIYNISTYRLRKTKVAMDTEDSDSGYAVVRRNWRGSGLHCPFCPQFRA